MKKLYSLIILSSLLLLVKSCSLSGELEEVSHDEPLTKSTFISKEQPTIQYRISEAVAESYIKDVYGNDPGISIMPYIFNEDTLFYVFNFTNGWKLVSSDSRTAPILAESDNGNVSLSDSLPLPLRIIMYDAKKMITTLRRDETIVSPNSKIWEPFQNSYYKTVKITNRDTDAHWVKVLVSSSNGSPTTIVNTGHLLQPKWGQDSPWNQKIPYDNLGNHCKVGCAAVAVGQIMYFLNQRDGDPHFLYENVSLDITKGYFSRNQIQLSSPTPHSTHWNSMALTTSSSGNTTYVADLLAYIGYEFNMSYGTSNSNTVLNTTKLTYVGLTGSSDNLQYNLIPTITQNIDNEKPVIAMGFPHPDSTGHAWVIDGYTCDQQNVSSTYRYYYVDDPSSLNGSFNGYNIVGIYSDEEMDVILPGYTNGSQTIEYNTITSYYFLMNWGEYNGLYDDIRVSPDLWILNGKQYNTNKSWIYNISAD